MICLDMPAHPLHTLTCASGLREVSHTAACDRTPHTFLNRPSASELKYELKRSSGTRRAISESVRRPQQRERGFTRRLVGANPQIAAGTLDLSEHRGQID